MDRTDGFAARPTKVRQAARVEPGHFAFIGCIVAVSLRPASRRSDAANVSARRRSSSHTECDDSQLRGAHIGR